MATTAQAAAFVAEIQSLGVATEAVAAPSPVDAASDDQQQPNAVSNITSPTVQIVTQSNSSPQSINESVATVASSQSGASTNSQTTATVVQPSIVPTTAGTPQFIAVAVSDAGDRADQDQVVQEAVTLQTGQAGAIHPTYVQTYSVYSVSEGGSMYTPASASYYNNTGATAVTPSQVQWLLDNYETAEGVSLPRRTLYQHYCRHCSDHKIEPVNAASFGKLIRSVFLGLRTRRLGTRGNSKYHYYGLRVKPDSPLVNISEDHGSAALRQQPLGTHKRLKVCSTRIDQNGSSQNLSSQQQSTSSSDPTSPTSAQLSQSHQLQTNPQQQQHQQYLGDSSTAVPHFINIDFTNNHLPDGITIENVTVFVEMYRDHCESFLDVVTNLQFSMVEMLWQNFWGCSQNITGETDRRMSKSQLYSLCKCEVIQEYVRRADYQFYQNLVDVLIPDVLRPIPSSLTQSIRNFAKSLEGWLASSMIECPDDIVTVKVSAVSAFAQTLRRYTSLNHLAQAARAVLQNSSQIHQMLADLNRVDFHNVQEQASWVCQCDDMMVQKLEEDFKATLQQQNSLEQWAAWLEGVVSQVLRPYEGKIEFPKAARQFLLKWSFYSSMVIRDLTLRSAASFGSFHLIRLLYDEYMFYLIEHRVAEATGETPIAVMGEFIGLGTRPSTANKEGLNYTNTGCGLSLVTNHSVSFSHQLCSERSTDSESSTSSTGIAIKKIEIPMKRIKPSL